VAKEVVVADRPNAKRFAGAVKPLLQLAESLRKANRICRKTRDLLLPRLLSGQLSLEDTA
jgi:type I restriction enzyme S subunit